MKGSKKKTGYKMETKATDQQLKNREILYKLFQDRPMSDEELLICPGLFMRSSALAKILFVNEAYQLILNQPGVIVEFGTWWGQNLILFENSSPPVSPPEVLIITHSSRFLCLGKSALVAPC